MVTFYYELKLPVNQVEQGLHQLYFGYFWAGRVLADATLWGENQACPSRELNPEKGGIGTGEKKSAWGEDTL